MGTIATINGIAEDNIATHNGGIASLYTSKNSDTWVHWGPPETLGTKVVFENAQTSYNEVAALSETKAVVIYRDDANSYYGTACVLDISGNTVTAGTPVVFNGNRQHQGAAITRLSSTKLLVSYSYYPSNWGRVLTVSGTNISLGAESSASGIFAASANAGGIIALSESLVVFAARNNSSGDKGKAVAGSISGTTLTWGTPVELSGNAALYLDVMALTATTALITFDDNNNTNTAIVATCSGTGNRTISLGTAVAFDGDVQDNSLASLSATKVVACYQDSGNSAYGTACVLDISGTSITAGTPTVFNSLGTSYIDCSELNASNLMVLYRQSDAGDRGYIRVMGVDGTTITPRTHVEITAGDALTYCDTTKLTATKVLVTYQDHGNSDYGTTRVIYNS